MFKVNWKISLVISFIVGFYSVIRLLIFILHPSSYFGLLYSLIGVLGTIVLGGYTLNLYRLQSKAAMFQEDWNDFKKKIPLYALTFVLSLGFNVLYFFLFAFITVSRYKHGGIGAETTLEWLYFFTFFVGSGWSIFIVQKAIQTHVSDIPQTVILLFSFFKWTAFCVLPIGIWASFYFYWGEGLPEFFAMLFWDAVFIGIYKLCSSILDRVRNQIDSDAVSKILQSKSRNNI
jgi:hypothetical protein